MLTLVCSSNTERSVRRLRLSKALTLPDSTTVADACRRMAARRVDACLLTDSSALLCGILTDRVRGRLPLALGLLQAWLFPQGHLA